jgi:hypothetical protein
VGKKWEGEALPSRNDSDWRFAISDWWMSFLEGSAPALPKIFGTSGDAPSKFFAE